MTKTNGLKEARRLRAEAWIAEYIRRTERDHGADAPVVKRMRAHVAQHGAEDWFAVLRAGWGDQRAEVGDQRPRAAFVPPRRTR